MMVSNTDRRAMTRYLETEVDRVMWMFLGASPPPEEERVRAELDRLVAMGRDMGILTKAEVDGKKTITARLRADRKSRIAETERNREKAELRAAARLLKRLEGVEALAKRLEAAEGSIMRNARTVMDDANAIMKNAEGLISRIAEKDKWLEVQEQVELEARLRKRMSASV